MAFLLRKTPGASEVKENFLLAAVAVTIDRVSYNVSGYASQATATSATTENVIGVAAETVDNSGGSVGDLSGLVEICPNAFYKIDTSGTPTQAQMHTSVAPVTNLGLVDEATAKTTDAGLVKMLKLLDATNKKILGRLNFWTVSDA